MLCACESRAKQRARIMVRIANDILVATMTLGNRNGTNGTLTQSQYNERV